MRRSVEIRPKLEPLRYLHAKSRVESHGFLHERVDSLTSEGCLKLGVRGKAICLGQGEDLLLESHESIVEVAI
jgi:hypothetical protein